MSLTGFVNRLSHTIANVTLGQGPGNFAEVGFVAAGGTFRQRENVDAVKVRGIEVSAEWSSGPWTVRAGASLSHARMEASGAAAFLNGLRPAQTPNFAGTLSANWERGGKGFEIDLRRVGAQFDDDLNQFPLRGYFVADVFAAHAIAPHLDATLAVENLFDRRVETAATPVITLGQPRTARVGLRFHP